jgi:glutamine synthetase
MISMRALRTTARLGCSAVPATASRAFSANFDGYGDHLFKGKVADKFLAKQGVAAGAMDDPSWTTTIPDQVAAAVLDWAKSHNASVYCHWFQPLGSSGVRHGLAGQVQNSMFEFLADGTPAWDFKGKALLKGETDGSSYPNGGLRATHTAGGYLAIDPSSPIFLRGDTIFIPACLVSYYGHALDEKTPLLRSNDAMSREGTRLLKLLGYNVDGIVSNIGLEQEIFLIPREAYFRRPDLQLTGRTVIGKDAPRGQEMCDHYMAPPSLTAPALACMQEIQAQCFKLGIPLRTRHREVAPNQYEFAPLFGINTSQIDQNVMVMQIIEEVAATYGLAALLQEKPFNNVNGSGKHNNWSIGTTCGTNILNVGQLAKNSGDDSIFPVIMSAIISAIDTHGDLMRMSVAVPGNEFRLGACEAPPAIMSTYLGDDMTNYMESYMNGDDKPYTPNTKMLDLGTATIAPLEVPAEDRNRTSPFPYGGHRFEFRAVGSAQNVSIVNTVLGTITADAFKRFADEIEGGKSPQVVAQDALKKHSKVIFNGDNYSVDEQEMLTERGVWRIDSAIEAIGLYDSEKNVKLFSDMGVLEEDECKARKTVMLDHYVGTVDIEALCMIDMINQHVLPSCRGAQVGPILELESAVMKLQAALAEIHATDDEMDKARLARVLRLETMVELRDICDAAEGVVPADEWTLATYKELLFLDQHDSGDEGGYM